jgi:hypothetical protein
MQRAVNPQTGEVLFLVNNQWTPPSQVATNPDTGQMAYLVNNQWQVEPKKKEEESGDVFVPALKYGFSGVQEAGYALAGRTGLMDEAAAQKAIEEEQAYQQRVFKPTEEGFLEAPVTKTLELLGQSLPFMVLPVAAAGATLALPVTGAAATVAGLGAAGLASGAQFTGTNLLRQMEPTDEAPKGKSIGETDLGDAALAAVPQAALDVLSLRMMPFIRGVFGQVGKDLSEEAARRIASKNLKDVAADYALATGKTMTVEGLTEAAQQSLERLQAGLTMTDEAARDEYLESFIGGAVLGGVLAPPGRYLERRAAQKEVPPETKPEPTATQPTAPTPITDEDELTPEEEADLQARIAAAPPAAGLPVAATPTQPLAPSAAVQQVTASPEAVALPGTQQLTPQAAPELEVLTAQLARIQQARMDPTLSPDDPAFLEFDQQEAAIQARIQQLTAPPAAVTQPPAQPLAPPVAPVVEPEVIPEDALVEAPVVTPPQIQGPRFGLSSVLDSPAQPLAPEITPPAAPVITPIIAQTPASLPQAPKGAADNFLDAVVTQFGMDRGEAQKALDTLVQEELIELDPNSGQFRMKDGRFWDPDVMRKAAAMQTTAPPLQLPQPLAPPVAPVVEPKVIPEEAMVEAPVVTPPATPTITAPPPSAPAVQATEPVGDLFETTGISEQPTRAPKAIAAEPSPIEKLAAKEPTVDEAIEEELKKAGYDDLGKMSKNIQDEFGVGKPVADAYARAVQNARIQVVRSQFGLVTESQLREALNEQTKLRNRIDGIVKRKEPKKEPEAEKKPSIRKTREVAEGTVVERIELPDNIEIRIVKLKNGYSVYQYDLDADQIVMGQQRQFRAPAFPKDQDAYQAAEAFASDMFDKVVPKMADEMQAAMKERLSRGEDVVNNKTPDPDIPADQRLVLMACCATKKKGMGMGPAIEVYTGVFFQTLKNKLKEGAMPNLRILSAKYGFIAPDQKIEVYDQVMDKSSADGFMLDDKLVEGFPSNIKDVLIVGSDQYQRVMKAAIEDLIKAGKIDKGASINVTKGGIGEQRAQLGRYLASLPVKKEPEAKKEVEPPTITPGQQRNLNYWRENVAPAIRDYLTAYKNVGVERLERSNFKPEGISATEWLLKVRSQKSIFGKGGRKVSETGIQMLSKKDLLPTVSGDGEVLRKAMLKAIQAINKAPGYTSDWIENMEAGSYDGIPDFEPRKEEKPKAEQFVRGTEEQLKEIKEFAKRYGGSEVAYYDPDKDIGMVLAFGKFDGDPKYIPYIKGIVGRTAFDISVAKFPEALPYKAELLEIKERLEKAAEKKHQENPFIKFERGIALSDGMDPKIEGIIREWKDMLGLGGINIYFSTTEDAKKNINNFTGPHRRIGSATIDANERGSMRRMEGGASYYVVFDKSTSTTKMLEVIAHEMGHVHEKVAFDQAPQELKDKLKAAYEKWLEGRKDKTSREAMQMLRAKTTAQTTDIGQTIETAEQLDKLDPYWSKFSEWYADQVSRWAVTDEKPVGVVEKFFARLGAALRRFYQTLKGQKYLPDETFVQYLKQVKPTIVETIPGPIKDQVNQDMSSKMLKDLFGSEKEVVDIKRIMEVYPPKKKLPPKRSPELAAAAAALNAGELTAAEYDALVNIYRPIPYYFEPLKPATEEQVIGALDVSKKPKANPTIQNGHRVGLRLDIPAFDRHGVFVVSIHQKRKPSSTGEIIGYASVAKAKNVTFGIGNELKALDIAMGKGKDALQTMEGEYVNITPEQAFAEAQRAIKDPSYVQVGFDPARHSYFFDRRTTLPVVSAEEVLQIGNMILAKKPVFGRKQDFLYNIDSAPVQSAAELDAKRDRENQEKLRDLQDLRPTKIALPEKVRSYASSEEGQRVIAALNMTGEELERSIQKQYEGYTADNFMRRARKGLDEGEISADVFAVVQSMYMADPKLLDGLRLDITQKFTPEELAQRRAEGKPSPMGAFAPFERVVYLYTGTKGVTDPMTIRHELTHTLEQLMTPAQRKAVVNAYIAALKKAAKKHKDAKSREFFDNVVKYLNEPSNDTRDAMNKSLPSLDFYQFTSPSEYWAVNAEKLMAQRLGVPWDRFKKAVRKMFEKMKNIFGFDNRFVVHDVFDKIMSGSKERMDTEMLANFVASSKQEYEMIEKTKEDAELVRRYNRTPTSQTDSAPLRRIMIGAAENSKDLFKSMVESPSEAINFMFNSVNRGVMFLRNKFIWFGSGINEADRIRYNGAVKTAEGLATASVALDNMIRGGNIATQVIMQGGIEFNKNTQMYGAVQKDKSMANVYRAEAKLKEKLGDQLGTDIEQGYLQAKRSRSIIDEVATREKAIPPLEAKEKETNAEIDRAASISKALDADPNTTATQRQASDVALRKAFREHKKALRELQDAQEELKTIKRIREDKVTMSEQEIADFIQREEAHPELKEILDNFNAVNQNLLRFWRDVGLLSEPRYERLSSIKDYVPWYRVMDDDADIHDPVQATTRSATNIGKEKLFKAGKPSVVTDFTVEENQKVFKVQPGAVNAVKLNGIRLKPDQYDVQPNGEITLKVEAKPGQLLVVETQREIENMIDNMTRNVMRMTMNGLRKYAANRIVSEYATREAGKIKRFATADRNKGRFDYIENGRRTIVEIQDPLIAEAVLGMETVGMKMWEPLAAAANFTRRTITLSPVFQLKQVFKDAPTAALVTGVRNPAALMGGVMRDFIGAVRGDDPVAEILRSQGIGGFYSPARTPEADVKRQIGIINNNTYDYVMKALDHFGDSSDMAQRIAIYKRVMAETGDETLALYQAANVINFLRHGSGQVAQALVKTVPFLNAYAQSIDVLYDACVVVACGARIELQRCSSWPGPAVSWPAPP